MSGYYWGIAPKKDERWRDGGMRRAASNIMGLVVMCQGEHMRAQIVLVDSGTEPFQGK